jgi:hypothetical protein
MLDWVGLPKEDTVWIATDLNNQDYWHGFHLALLDEELSGLMWVWVEYPHCVGPVFGFAVMGLAPASLYNESLPTPSGH